MSQPPFDLQRAHRWFAVEFNNAAWDLVESPSCTKEEAERMVHLAHAACLHWSQAGTAVNQQRALCLLAHVYAALGQAGPAVEHARRCMDLSERNGGDQTEFDRATAYECLARASACAGLVEEADRLKRLARDAGGRITEAEERQAFEQMLERGEWCGGE